MVSARLAYMLLFLSGQVVSWLLRDYSAPMLKKLPWVMKAYTGMLDGPPKAWFGYGAVLRLSLGNTLFFGLLALSLLGVKTTADPRHKCAAERAGATHRADEKNPRVPARCRYLHRKAVRKDSQRKEGPPGLTQW